MLPLSGITVVTLEQAVAAPFATRQLADLGARVVKIERPGVGDFARGYDEAVLGQASYFVWLNRSKESIGLDLKDARGLAILDELLSGADVFVQNLGPNATTRLGLSRDQLVARYPQLIVCEISGYGIDGPWADRKAYDLLVQCESGVVSLTGEGDVSAKVGISVADIAAGMHAYSGILVALYRRVTTGEVSSVEVSIFEALLEWMGSPLYYTMYSGRHPSRMGLEHATIAPYGPYETKDGETIVLAVQNEREWQALCEILLGDATISAEARFSTNSARVENRVALRELINAKVSLLGTKEVTAVLDTARVAHARVNTVYEAIDHPALLGRDRWRDLDTPGGEIRALIPPAVLSGVEARMDAVPALGAHTASILAELGRSDSDIAELASAGVVSVAAAAL